MCDLFRKLDGFNDIQIAKFAGEKPPLLNGIDLDKHDLTKYSKMKKLRMPEAVWCIPYFIKKVENSRIVCVERAFETRCEWIR